MRLAHKILQSAIFIIMVAPLAISVAILLIIGSIEVVVDLINYFR